MLPQFRAALDVRQGALSCNAPFALFPPLSSPVLPMQQSAACLKHAAGLRHGIWDGNGEGTDLTARHDAQALLQGASIVDMV